MEEKETCNFETGNCTLTCKKYPMCSYMSVQKQLTSLQQQITYMYTAINKMMENQLEIKSFNEEINNKLESYTCEILDIINSEDNVNRGL